MRRALWPHDVVEQLGVTVRQAYRIMRAAGGYYVTGNAVRLDPEDLESWKEKQRKCATVSTSEGASGGHGTCSPALQ